MATMAEIEKFGQAIGREFHPHRVVLFGSHAYGTPDEDSDVDILVVMSHGERKGFRMATKIRLRTRPPFPLDIIVRTPEQLKERLALGDAFLKEITEQGRVLYESANA